jgi:hypothetical protein
MGLFKNLRFVIGHYDSDHISYYFYDFIKVFRNNTNIK